MIKRHSPRTLRVGPAMAFAALAAVTFTPALAQNRAGDFDYYVMALSWSPSWCATTGARQDTQPEQCDPRRDLGFTLHGLWPQFDAGGWPEYCITSERDPSRGESRKMSDIMGSPGLAWYEWKKHGRCSGLSARAYYDLSRRAYSSIDLPDFSPGHHSARDIERAFLDTNPSLSPDDLIVSCSAGMVREVRVCLSPDLDPMACAADVIDDACQSNRPLEMPPIP